MRIARTLLLAALTALAALAFTATNASAVHVEQEVDEVTMADCEPCFIHADSTQPTVLVHKVAGPLSRCTDELEGEIYEDGTGHAELMSAVGVGCNAAPCAGDEAEWPVEIVETGGALQVNARFCVSLFGGPPAHCDLTVDLTDEGTHMWVLDSPGYECQNSDETPVFVFGNWELEELGENVNIEISH